MPEHHHGIPLGRNAPSSKTLIHIQQTAPTVEVRSLAANPPTLAMRVEVARADLAAKQAAADAANREHQAAAKSAADAKKSHDAALATSMRHRRSQSSMPG